MADEKSKSEQRREAITNDAATDQVDADGLRPFYFPDANQTVRAKDYSSAKEKLKTYKRNEADDTAAKEGEK